MSVGSSAVPAGSLCRPGPGVSGPGRLGILSRSRCARSGSARDSLPVPACPARSGPGSPPGPGRAPPLRWRHRPAGGPRGTTCTAQAGQRCTNSEILSTIPTIRRQGSSGTWRVQMLRAHCASAHGGASLPFFCTRCSAKLLCEWSRELPQGERAILLSSTISNLPVPYKKEELTTNPGYQCKWNEIPRLHLQDWTTCLLYKT